MLGTDIQRCILYYISIISIISWFLGNIYPHLICPLSTPVHAGVPRIDGPAFIPVPCKFTGKFLKKKESIRVSSDIVALWGPQ